MTTPFTRILLPYDGSEPANAAMSYAIALGRSGAALDVVYVVDERPLIAQSATTIATFDPIADHRSAQRAGRSHRRYRPAAVS